jgi:hypothetical protein
MRIAGIPLLLVAVAAIALGSPLCCLLGTGCCGAAQRRVEAQEARGCPHCRHEKPQPAKPGKPCEQKGCTCKSDVAPHAGATADHAATVAVVEAPALSLSAPAALRVEVAESRALPASPSRNSHPLLL